MDFYSHTLSRLLAEKSIDLGDRILVLCASTHDAETFHALGFRDVTISNLDERYDLPSNWVRQDAEALTFPDNSFDWAIVHAGLHHCASPHRAFLEMCRVSRKGALAIEARDSVVMRLAASLRLTETHECSVVLAAGYGGVRSSPIPNYIYRWTEREVRKVIESAYPQRVNDVRFFYGLRMPPALHWEKPLRHRMIRMLWYPLRALQALFPRQCNSFGFAVLNSGRVKPWMADEHTVREGRRL